jgi:carbonic anhydrase/acetyltransferase-like protein (isoleucine patch superfamily)
MIRAFENITPTITTSTYIDEQASVIGDVHIGEDSSVWPFTVLRGDVNKIRIGNQSNIQDNSTVHVSHDSKYNPGGFAASIGNQVTVGHQVIIHACTIRDRCLIGMGSLIMDGVVVEEDTIVGAGSLITQNKILEGGYLWMGRPAKRVRALTDEEKERIVYSADHYVRLKNRYLEK